MALSLSKLISFSFTYLPTDDCFVSGKSSYGIWGRFGCVLRISFGNVRMKGRIWLTLPSWEGRRSYPAPGLAFPKTIYL